MESFGIGKTDVGRHRTNNEDCLYVDDGLGLYIVSDGMGGHAAGEVASQLAVETATRVVGEHRDLVTRYIDKQATRTELASICEQALQQACHAVHQLATTKPEHAGMGCTLTLLLAAGSEAAIGHVGDSRLYLSRAGLISQLSHDHTIGAELLRAGLADQSEIMTHQYRNSLTRTIGTQPAVKVDTLVIDVLPDDLLVLCSDGLSNYIEEPQKLAELLLQKPFDDMAAGLVDYANESGGHDNTTVLTVRIAAGQTDPEEIRLLADRVQRRLDILSALFLFKDLSLPVLTQVLNACAVRRIPAGETVISEGDLCDGLFIVADGSFALTQNNHPMGELSTGDYTGVATILRPREARATMTAKADSRLLHLNRSRLFWLIHGRPSLGVALLERLGWKLSEDLDRSVLQRDDGDQSTTPLVAQERL